MTNKNTPKDYEALNRRLMAAIVTLTGVFFCIAFALYLLLGR